MKVKKSVEVSYHGARSAIVVEGKLYVAYKNKLLKVYDCWTLEQVFQIKTEKDMVRIFHHFYDIS